jgi:hypothetical protein
MVGEALTRIEGIAGQLFEHKEQIDGKSSTWTNPVIRPDWKTLVSTKKGGVSTIPSEEGLHALACAVGG